MAEQFVGQELVAAQNDGPFYWARDKPSSTAEVDYLAVLNGTIHGVEVKSGPAGKLRSLHAMQQAYPQVGAGLVFSAAPYAELPAQKLTFLPLYYAFSATREPYPRRPRAGQRSNR